MYHQKYESTLVLNYDRCVVMIHGQIRMKNSNVGWKLLLRCMDVSDTWIPLKPLNNLHPVEVSKYAIARVIDGENYFSGG